MRQLLFGCALLLAGMVAAQDAVRSDKEEKEAVLKVVNTLFDGMCKGDSAMVHSVFHPDARLITSYLNRERIPSLETTSLNDFLEAVGAPHAMIWDEQLVSVDVHLDRTMAQVWAPYRFYAGSTFSHCGTDAFHLVKTSEGWKIIQLTDTRTTDCP